MFFNELKEFKVEKLLKSTNPIRDYSDPKLAGYLTKIEIENYQDCVLNCNIECWYELIKECTFPTVFLAIDYSEASLFVNIYEKYFKDKSDNLQSELKHLLDSNELEQLVGLETRLSTKISEFNSTDSVFIKTSSRSAKDSPLATQKFTQLYLEYYNCLAANEKASENEKLICLLRAAFQMLKIRTASDALNMFLKSERIYQDMLLAIKMPHRFKENFVIRKFYEIDVDMEFRGFVFNGKLNALSQYNYLIYSERLSNRKELISELILKFFNEILGEKLLAYGKEYIIDFAVLSSELV